MAARRHRTLGQDVKHGAVLIWRRARGIRLPQRVTQGWSRWQFSPMRPCRRQSYQAYTPPNGLTPKWLDSFVPDP